MQLSDLTLLGFICLGGIRCFSYVPQIVRIARDENGASAISYTTWCVWTLANLATASYAGLNLHDPYLTAVSCIYTLCCAVVILLTAIKRAQHKNRKQITVMPAEESEVRSAARNLVASTTTPRECCIRPSHEFELQVADQRNQRARLDLEGCTPILTGLGRDRKPIERQGVIRSIPRDATACNASAHVAAWQINVRS